MLSRTKAGERSLSGIVRIATVSVLVLGTGLVSFMQKPKDWETVYLPAANRLRSGQDIFQQAYVYPPFQALLAVPFSFLSPLAGRALWACLNSAAAALFLIGAWRLSGGRRFFDWDDGAKGEDWIFWLGLAASIG